MVEGVRRSLEANRAAYEALRGKLRAGMTELDAYGIVGETVDAVCGDEPHEFIGDFVGGMRSGAIEGPATDYIFKPGDAFILDLSVRRGATWSDTCRTFFFGEPTAEQRKAYETVIACQELGERIVRPGVVFEDVKAESEQFLLCFLGNLVDNQVSEGYISSFGSQFQSYCLAYSSCRPSDEDGLTFHHIVHSLSFFLYYTTYYVFCMK